MKYLFDNWDEVAGAVSSSAHALILLDYDGTTVPIEKTPELVRLDEGTRRLLGELAAIPRVTLGIISGRSIDDICSRVGLDGLIYVGNHGLEVLLPGRPAERLYDDKILRLIHGVFRELQEQLSDIAGVVLEEKGPIVAVHYRTADPVVGVMLLKIANGIVSENPGLAVRQGKMVIEITPNMSFSKGAAVKRLLENAFGAERPVVVFAGDDLTDEDVFVILGEGDVSIYVGPQTSRFSAKYYVKDSTETRRFLSELCALLRSL